MSDTTNNTGSEVKDQGTIEFLEFHLPALMPGQYEIEVSQTVTATKTNATVDNAVDETFPKKMARFYVAGERSQLAQAQIHSIFPPDASLGDHSMVLPHIIFNSSTLPWQRNYRKLSAAEQTQFDKDKDNLKAKLDGGTNPSGLSKTETELLKKLSIPWMALLLFYEEEIKDESVRGPKVVKRSELTSGSDYSFNELTKEIGEKEDDKITVIEVKTSLLNDLMPVEADLEFLSHVRLIKETDTDPGTELAVIIGNRMPKIKGISTVHLVSIEQQFGSDGKFMDSDKDYVRLISLKSWSFACIDPNQSFEGLLKHLNGYAGVAKGGANIKTLDPTDNTLRIPSNTANTDIKKYFDTGYVALPQDFRNDQSSISWYHGPFVSGPLALPNNGFDLPILNSDDLLVFSSSTGMFEVSYAAAWELGRLLALQSKDFSISLFNWKRRHVQKLLKSKQSHALQHTSFAGEKVTFDMPKHISDWLTDLNLLKGLPFNYLVPDERMLPKETLRFFQVDPVWVDCLLDGAFGVGRANEIERKHDNSHEDNPARNQHRQMSGLLMRSDIVSGWKALQVVGYSSVSTTPETTCQLLRMERLSKNILLCLFDQEIVAVDFHVKPEALHYGFKEDKNNTGDRIFNKNPKDKDGQIVILGKPEDKPPKYLSIPIKLKTPNIGSSQNVVNISEVIEELESKQSDLKFSIPLTSAQFALSLSETGEKVRYSITK